MLRWDFKERCGNVVDHNGDVRNWYEGNALMIVLSEWTEDEGKEYYSLHEFFIDKDHMKNCFGLAKGYANIYKCEEWQELTIDMKYCHNWKTIIELVTKVMPNCKITLYRSEM